MIPPPLYWCVFTALKIVVTHSELSGQMRPSAISAAIDRARKRSGPRTVWPDSTVTLLVEKELLEVQLVKEASGRVTMLR